MNADLNLDNRMSLRRRTGGLGIVVIPNSEFLVLSHKTTMNELRLDRLDSKVEKAV